MNTLQGWSKIIEKQGRRREEHVANSRRLLAELDAELPITEPVEKLVQIVQHHNELVFRLSGYGSAVSPEVAPEWAKALRMLRELLNNIAEASREALSTVTANEDPS